MNWWVRNFRPNGNTGNSPSERKGRRRDGERVKIYYTNKRGDIEIKDQDIFPYLVDKTTDYEIVL